MTEEINMPEQAPAEEEKSMEEVVAESEAE